jgi:hypothetical protein
MDAIEPAMRRGVFLVLLEEAVAPAERDLGIAPVEVECVERGDVDPQIPSTARNGMDPPAALRPSRGSARPG